MRLRLGNWKWLTCLQRSDQFLPLLLFARKRISSLFIICRKTNSSKWLNTPLREKEENQIKLKLWFLFPAPKISKRCPICKHTRAEWDSLCFRSKESNYTFLQRLETVTVRISMENLGSSLNSRLSTTGWNEKKVKKKLNRQEVKKETKRQKGKKTKEQKDKKLNVNKKKEIPRMKKIQEAKFPSHQRI